MKGTVESSCGFKSYGNIMNMYELVEQLTWSDICTCQIPYSKILLFTALTTLKGKN